MKRYYLTMAALAVICAIALLLNQNLGAGLDHDAKVQADVLTITREVNRYTQSNFKLPATLTQLGLIKVNVSSARYASNPTFSRALYMKPSDYKYEVAGSKSYKLCANFQSDDSHIKGYSPTNLTMHKRGNTCFEIQVTIPPRPTPSRTPVSASVCRFKLCSTAVANSDLLAATRVVTEIDAANRKISSRLSTDKPADALIHTWGPGSPDVYDKSCNPISLSQIKVGDLVNLAFETDAKTISGIQKVSN